MNSDIIKMLIEKFSTTDLLIVGLMFLLYHVLSGIRKPLENINHELMILIAAVRSLKIGDKN